MSKKPQFALFSPQAGLNWKALLDRTKLCEKLGFHSIWLVDHMWTGQMPDLDHVECLTAMSGLAAATEAIRIGTLVICNSYRNPALLAKSLCTIDQISDGRLEIRKQMLTEKRANFTGRYYTVADAINNPKGVQKPHPPITIGGSGEKVMLKLVAKYADRWNCPAGYQSFEQKFNVLKQHCKDIGRDLNTIDISEQLLVCIGKTEDELAQKWTMAQGLRPFS